MAPASSPYLTSGENEHNMSLYRAKLQKRLAKLSATWQSAKVVRTRTKIAFFCGVMSLVASTLVYAWAPQYTHIAYTLQIAYFLPLRLYKYRRINWHYFLVDFCYYATALNLLFIWVLPSNVTLWITCYCLSHGGVAWSVVAWNNALVFHDLERVTTLFVHIYAPMALCAIRHYYGDDLQSRFPAVAATSHMPAWQAIYLTALGHLLWQALYWKFVMVNRRRQIQSGELITSFTYTERGKRGTMGMLMHTVKPRYRETLFRGAQFVYSIVTALPAIFVFYYSSYWSGAFLLTLLAVSTWNGSGYYVEVFGRKFERDLDALRAEIASGAYIRSTAPSPDCSPAVVPYQPEDDVSSFGDSPPSAAMVAMVPLTPPPDDKLPPEGMAGKVLVGGNDSKGKGGKGVPSIFIQPEAAISELQLPAGMVSDDARLYEDVGHLKVQ